MNSFRAWYYKYKQSKHCRNLVKATIKYYDATCCHCQKKFPPSELTVRHLSFQHVGHESIGIDVICCCMSCLKSVFVQPVPHDSTVKLIKVSINAFFTQPKWHNFYDIVSSDKLRNVCILQPKSELDLTKIAVGSL